MAKKLSKRIMIELIVDDFNMLPADQRVQLVVVGKDAVRKFLKKNYTKQQLEELINNE